MISQPSNLSRSLEESVDPLNLVSSANLPGMHLSPVFRWFIKTLKTTGAKTEPWGIPLVTGYHPDATPFMTALFFRCFSRTHRIIFSIFLPCSEWDWQVCNCQESSFLPLLENWDNIQQLPDDWDLSKFPRPLKNNWKRSHEVLSASSLITLWWMPLGPKILYASSWSSKSCTISEMAGSLSQSWSSNWGLWGSQGPLSMLRQSWSRH